MHAGVRCARGSRAAQEASEGHNPRARDALDHCATAVVAPQSAFIPIEGYWPVVEPPTPVMAPALALMKPCVNRVASYVQVTTEPAVYVVADGVATTAESTTGKPMMVVSVAMSFAEVDPFRSHLMFDGQAAARVGSRRASTDFIVNSASVEHTEDYLSQSSSDGQ